MEFEKCSSHIYRQVRAIGSATPRFPQSPQRNMQNNACTEQGREGEHRTGEGMRGGGKKTKTEKADAQSGGRAFFSLFEISDVNRKQGRQLVKSTVCKHPIGKINVLSPSPMFKPDMA